MDNEQERNEHFKGFANLLIQEIDEQVGAVVEWGLEHDASEKEIARELASRWNTLIAQRAYDLVKYATEHINKKAIYTEHPRFDAFMLAIVPDLTEWPTP